MAGEAGTIEVRAFGRLRSLLAPGAAYPMHVAVGADGISGREVAAGLGLPDSEIEAVFRNGLVVGLTDPLHPGDRIAFIPRGVPGPYRLFLGMIQHSGKRECAG
jgi:hypothetical protein